MPDLPTINVTQAQADRMLAAFGSVPKYKEWLRQQIVNHVLSVEVQGVQQEVEVAQRAKRQEVIDALPKPPPPPAEPPPVPTP